MSTPKASISERFTHLVTIGIRFAIFVAGVYGVFNERWSLVFAAAGTLVLSYIPQLLASQIRVKIPLQFQFAITLFLYASIFLGEFGDYYERFWWWDVVLHGCSAFAFGFVGFLTMYLLYSRHKLAASPFLVCMFAFTFGLAIGAIWEIVEFTLDTNFGLTMQRNSLRDTMWDLIVDAIGAGTASFIGYVYLRFKVPDPFDTFINWFLRENPQFTKQKLLRSSKR